MPPLVIISAAWIVGLIVAHHWLVPADVAPVELALVSLIPFTSLVLWWHDRRMRLASFAVLALLLAAVVYQTDLPDLQDPTFVAHYNDSGWVTMEGTVSGYPDVRDTWTYLEFSADSLETEQELRQIHGTVRVRVPRFPEYNFGDRLRVSGFLQTPVQFPDFSYRDYLKRKGMYSTVYYPKTELLASETGGPIRDAIFALKDRARDLIARLMPDPEASLLQGILLGIQSGIPRGLYEDYNTTGTSHILVVSGFNITIVSGVFVLVFSHLLGRRRACWFAFAGIVFYVLLVGADPAVVRAGIMGALFVTAIYLGRRSTAYVSLLAVAVVLTALNPQALWDISFQLSFAATLSLILFSPVLERLVGTGLQRVASPDRAQQAVNALREGFIATLAALVLTIPLVVVHFGRLSLVAPLANLLILAVQQPIMILGGIATLIGLVPALEPVAQVVAWIPWLFLNYTTAVVRWMASWPFASLAVSRASAGWFLLGYGFILGTIWFLGTKRSQLHEIWQRSSGGWSAKLTIGTPMVAALLIWLAVLQLPDGRLHVAFLDVGQGDAVLITTPDGRQVLVDGGPSPVALTYALGKEMPFWDRSMDLIVLTHSDADHITGLQEVLERFHVDNWLENGYPDDDIVYAKCQSLLNNAGVARHIALAGDRYDLGQGLTLEVLHPPRDRMPGADASANDTSIVVRLQWNEASVLLTGDIEAKAESLLLQSGTSLASDLLKVAHHGSNGSSTVEFLQAVSPSYAVISAGSENRFGHPHQDVLERLTALEQVQVLRTDQHGTIELSTDGRQWELRTER
jgi:competence protein ComEC